MTTIRIIGSSSTCNCYIIDSGGKILLLECGVSMNEIIRNIGNDFNRIVGCTSTHVHGDHMNASTANELVKRGIPVYMGEDVLKEVDFTQFLPILSGRKNEVGGFTIQPFKVAHNVPNYGFLIETPNGERIVFVTDAIECRYKFKDIDCIMVECNHDDDTMLDNLDKNEVSMSHPENHLGLHDCIAFCKANMNPHLKQVILIHLSHQNINEEYALKSVQDAMQGIPVSVAHPNDTFTFENDNF